MLQEFTLLHHRPDRVVLPLLLLLPPPPPPLFAAYV
jgi:hypothetical protein